MLLNTTALTCIGEGDLFLIDVGNSGIKWCLASKITGRGKSHTTLPKKQLQLDFVYRCELLPERLLGAFEEQVGDVDLSGIEVWFSSVANADFDDAFVAALKEAGFSVVHRAETLANQAGLVNSYSEPTCMGVDRWLAMLGARAGFREPLVVIDAGSALTVDLVSEDGLHEGGYILPGVGMMERSLLNDTQRVRYEGAAAVSISPGQSTLDCVSGGVWVAALGAIKLILQRVPKYRVVITGGDGQALISLGLKGEWRPNLVLEGLGIAACT